MSRPLKFRAWDVWKKEMVDPHGLIFVPGVACKRSIYGDVDVNPASKDWVVMQYTGLDAENCDEIFEDDIVEDQRGQFGRVFYYRDGFRIEWRMRKFDGSRDVDAAFEYVRRVAGNIWENPKLLEDK